MKTRVLAAVMGASGLLTPVAEGWAAEMTVKVEWRMGEGESRAVARELALQKAKLQAASNTRTVVQMTSTLENDVLKESVKVVGLSGIKVLKTDESVRVDSSGNETLTLVATLDVDESEVERRAKAMSRDIDKAKLIRDLVEANQSLELELEMSGNKGGVRNGLHGKVTRSSEDLLRRLREHVRASSNAFSRESLVEMAMDDAAEIEAEVDRVLEGVVGALYESKVKARVIEAEEVDGGLMAGVAVSWNYDQAKVKSSLEAWVMASNEVPLDGSATRAFRRHEFLDGRHGSRRSDRVWGALSASSVWIEVYIGNAMAKVPVMYRVDEIGFSGFDSCRFSTDRQEHQRKVMCIIRSDKVDGRLFGVEGGLKPVRLKVTGLESKKATGVVAFVVKRLVDGSIHKRRVESL